MNYYAHIISVISFLLIFGAFVLWARTKERNMTETVFTVRKPIFMVILGAVITLFFGFLCIATLSGGNIDPVLLIIAVFLALGLYITADTLYWRLNVNKTGITYRYLFHSIQVINF